jgi:hypothetical protein
MADDAMGQETCRKCDRMLTTTARVCACGYPTARATFQERIDWELREYRSWKTRPQSA